MYPKEFFIEQFQNKETDQLLRRYATVELTEEAKEAILEILKKRGVSPDKLGSLVRQAKKDSYRQSRGTTECDHCGNSARFSPVLDGGQRFCSKSCLRKARLLEISVDISETEIVRHARNIKIGECPDCHRKDSKVEVRYYYRVWSAAIITQWTKRNHVCCRACGRQTNFGSLMFCLLLGWWGIPWGIIITPAQIISNIVEMFKARDEPEPSEELIAVARINLAAARARQQQAEAVDA
ncbi:hypothetical protein H8K35_14665 [Undibacterium sp. LX40W]|uniref:Uncharacterized protein n=1 Tax=Undibacterium nitidum TaxID=2762298 RepID=A0A923KUX7_9BURK|nr:MULTISPECIES: hypothetical protein [Undibacterium]MBC3882632.1 hypothetical protein [Undibacterium nitidum]MBC3892913.1 hypothetical protein [Undibacterium sp. LX40W]